MNSKSVKSLAAEAVAVLFALNAAGMAEAASPEKQLSLLAERADLWGAGPAFAESVRDNDRFAVTDLDGNGRLELFIVKSVRNPVPGANPAGSNEEKGLALVATVPVTVRPRGYEVSADGKQLEELKFRYTDAVIPPNLTNLNMGRGHYYADDKTRSYNISTLNRVGKLGFRLYEQVLSLKDGTLTVQTIGTRYGNYGLFSEMATAEAVLDYCETRDGGKTESEKVFEDYIAAYFAGTDPADTHTQWIPADRMEKAMRTPGGARSALAESWKGFRFERKAAK